VTSSLIKASYAHTHSNNPSNFLLAHNQTVTIPFTLNTFQLTRKLHQQLNGRVSFSGYSVKVRKRKKQWWIKIRTFGKLIL